MTSMELKQGDLSKLALIKQQQIDKNIIELSPSVIKEEGIEIKQHTQNFLAQGSFQRQLSKQEINKVHVISSQRGCSDEEDVENKFQIDVDSIIEILKQSLYGPYQVKSEKFDVVSLIREDKILPHEIENELRTKIKFKVNCENK